MPWLASLVDFGIVVVGERRRDGVRAMVINMETDFAGVATLLTAIGALVAPAINARVRVTRLTKLLELRQAAVSAPGTRAHLDVAINSISAKIAVTERLGGYTAPLAVTAIFGLGIIAIGSVLGAADNISPWLSNFLVGVYWPLLAAFGVLALVTITQVLRLASAAGKVAENPKRFEIVARVKRAKAFGWTPGSAKNSFTSWGHYFIGRGTRH